MIINVTYGGSAPGVARYIGGAAKENGRDVPGTEERATLLGSEGFGFPVQTQDDVRLALAVLRRDVELQASNTRPVENTVIHASMSWPHGYEPSREEMRDAAEHLAKAWGMEAHRRISWSHEETKHRHTHTLFGSIHPDSGYAHHDNELNDRAQRAAITWEREHGIPPTRQKDHDIAQAAEASDHARTLELSKATDGSIKRIRLDRALALGGHFGKDRGAQRAEFIARNDLTRFPAQEFAYSSKPLAAEKTEYIQENRNSASSLTRAYGREGKERAHGVWRLYEDHSFEKTSKPPTQEEGQTGMGINDILDWPWKKAGEVIKRKWQEKFPERDFGREVEEKGWDDPGVKRQWEKKYGHLREEKREPVFPRQAQESRLAKWYEDQMAKPRPEHDVPLPPRTPSAEEQRLKNWQTQRERRDKEEGHTSPKSETPPWRKDEQRSEQWRQQKEDERDERNSRPLPLTRDPKDQIYRPQQSRETPALPRPREIPMPEIELRDRATAGRGDGLDESLGPKGAQAFRDRIAGGRKFNDMMGGSKELPEQTLDRFGYDDQMKKGLDASIKRQIAEQLRNAYPEGLGQPKESSSDKTIERMDKDLIEREERKMPHHRRPFEPDRSLDGRPAGARSGKAHEFVPTPLGREKPREWPRRNEDRRTPQQIEQDEHGMIGKQIPDNSQEIENKHRQRAQDFRHEQSPEDGTAGQGRKDRTEAGKPGLLPGGSHEHGSPSQQFHDQLTESLRDIKPPKREIGKDRERER